jgi:hypothetical protein
MARTSHKTEFISVIASKVGILPGHISRTRFVDEVSETIAEFQGNVFGRGRSEIDTKEEGLSRFRYSLAIENSRIPSYFTEKLIDPILRDCVPVYFGAPDLQNYLPDDSFIALEKLDISLLREVLSSLSDEDYELRRPALEEAKRIVNEEFRLCCWLVSEHSKVRSDKLVRVVLGTELSALFTRLRTMVHCLVINSRASMKRECSW